MSKEFDAEVNQKKRLYELETNKAREFARIETTKFKQIIDAVGRETLIAISKAGPEMKVKLLESLGLKGYLITDGKSPVNLFNTANGLIGNLTKQMGGNQFWINSITLWVKLNISWIKNE